MTLFTSDAKNFSKKDLREALEGREKSSIISKII